MLNHSSSFSSVIVDRKYYLFFYLEKPISIDFLYQSVDVLHELDSKKRQIRSLRGFFLYALEIMEAGTDVEVLKTNLQPFFWRKVKNIIRQNKKGALLKFLFGNSPSDQSQTFYHEKQNIKGLEEKIQTLQDQVNFLQQKVIELETNLENQTRNSKYALRGI